MPPDLSRLTEQDAAQLNALTDEQLLQLFPPEAAVTEPQGPSSLYQKALGVADAATLGWADEAASWLQSKHPKMGYNREAQQQKFRQDLAEYQKQYPGESLALGIGTAVIPGALGAGRALLGKGAAAATEAAIPLWQRLTGATLLGGGASGAYGAGSANEGHRLIEGAKGLALGAGTGAGFGILVNALGGPTSKQLLASEAGKIGRAANDVGLEAKLYLANKMSDIAPAKLTEALSKVAEAKALDIPAFPIDYIPSRRLENLAKRLANFGDTADMAQTAIKDRIKGGLGRIEAALGDVAEPSKLVGHGAEVFQDALGNVVEKARGIQKAAGAAFDKVPDILEGPEIDDILASPTLSKLAESVKAQFPEHFADLPSNSFQVLQAVKGKLDDKISTMLRAGKKHAASLYGDLKQELVEGIDSSIQATTGTYRQALDKYKNASQLLNKLQGHKWGNKRTYGLFERILTQDPTQTPAAVEALLKMAPKQAEKVRRILGTEGRDKLRIAVRYALEERASKINWPTDELVDIGKFGQDAIAKILPSKDQNTLRALLGTKDFEKLLKKFNIERQIWVSSGRFHMGSDTARYLEEGRNIGKLYQGIRSAIGTAKGIPPVDLAINVARRMREPSDDTLKYITRALFSPDDADTLAQLPALLQEISQQTRQAGSAGAISSVGASSAAQQMTKRK